jgi:hypothetical protein
MSKDNDNDAIVYYDYILKKTEQAVLYKIDDREVWIPKSVHEDFEDGSLAVQEWFAIKEELI